MNYEALAIERAELQIAINRLIATTRASEPLPAIANRDLRHLVALVHNHLSHAEPMVHAAAAAARDSRHADVASAALAELQALKDDWCDYLYRWNRAAIANDWPVFTEETAALLGPLNARIRSELAILFSLAVHLGLMPATS